MDVAQSAIGAGYQAFTLGFALENFDVIGGWRDHYRSIGEGTPVHIRGKRMRYKHGPPVDASDVLSDGRRFDNIDQYKRLILSDKDQLARALAVKLLTYATGVATTAADQASSLSSTRRAPCCGGLELRELCPYESSS